MINKFVLFTGILVDVFFTFLASAQVPGYQGRHLSLNLNLDGFVAFTNPTYVSNLTAANYPDSHINTRWMLDIDYVVARNGSVGISLQYLRTGYTTQLTELVNDPYNGYISEDINTFIDITTIGAGAYYKFFFYGKSGGIAPIGYYGRLDAIVFLSSAEGAPNGGYQFATDVVTNYGHVATNFAITYTLGSQSVFLNHLITNYGIEFGVIPSYLSNIGSDGNNDAGTNSADLANAVRARLSAHILTNIRLGLGYLLF